MAVVGAWMHCCDLCVERSQTARLTGASAVRRAHFDPGVIHLATLLSASPLATMSPDTATELPRVTVAAVERHISDEERTALGREVWKRRKLGM